MISLGFIGFGKVGQATAAMFDTDKTELMIFDPKIDNGVSIKDIAESCPMIFIAVPTPFINDGTDNIDTTILSDTLSELEQLGYDCPVVVRTTCYPGMMDGYDLNIVHWPCFIREYQTYDEFVSDQMVSLLGGDADTTQAAKKFINQLSVRHIEFYCAPLNDVAAAKLCRNLYGAYKVLFWNFVHNIFGNSRAIYNLISKLPPQGDCQIVGLDNEPGYGGYCFPNNVQLAIQQSSAPDPLLTFIQEYNDHLHHEYNGDGM